MSDDRTPRIAPPEGFDAASGASGYIGGHLPEYASVLGRFGAVTMRQRDLDPRTLEIARLRNAAQMRCRLCMSLRRQSALEGGLDEATISLLAADGAGALDRRDHVVVELVDAYLATPGRLPTELVERIQQFLTPAEIAQLLLSLAVWTGNRVLVALGLDEPADADLPISFDYLPDGRQRYAG